MPLVGRRCRQDRGGGRTRRAFLFLRRVPSHGSVGGIAFAWSASHCSDMTRRWSKRDSNPRSL
jgi:hypothetical protein